MRTIASVLFVVATGVVGAGMARAQDATSIAVSQAGQQAMDLAVQASQQAIDAMNQATQLSIQQAQLANQAAIENSVAMRQPPLPVTPKPVIMELKGGVSVILQDADPRAIVFYTTDGSVPTVRSSRYVGPIGVGSTVKVRAMAFDLEFLPSGVVSKTIRVKS